MQNAKDTFYLVMRNQLAQINPARQVSIAGVLRPGILVEENETPAQDFPLDVFVLRWAGLSRDTSQPATLEAEQCEIVYATSGSPANERMDRGRALTEMDAELALMLQPGSVRKMSVGSTLTVPMQTNVFWGDPVFSPVVKTGVELSRTVTVEVFALQDMLQGGLER